MFNELVKVIENNKVMFSFVTFGFDINTEVINYEIKEDCILYIHDGKIIVGKDCEVKKCDRPINEKMVECEFCFRLTNFYSEHIGYIYCKKEDI